MFYIAISLCWAACAVAAPASTDVVPLEKQQPTVIPIVSQSEELEPNGTYKFSYETGNGIKREETSYDKVVPKAKGRSADSNEGGESDDDSDEIHVQIGSYSYTAPDGTLISVRYIADENGFQPIGDHIPRIGGPSPASSERGSKALKAKDSSSAGSTPEAAAKPSKKSSQENNAPSIDSRSAADSKILEKSPEMPEEVSTTEAANASTTVGSTTGVANGSEAPSDGSTTEAANASETPAEGSTAAGAEGSTTESANTTDSSTEGSTTEAANNSETTVVLSTTEAATSETTAAGLTTGAGDVSTTEAAKSSEASVEGSTTEASNASEAATEGSTTEAQNASETTTGASTEAASTTASA